MSFAQRYLIQYRCKQEEKSILVDTNQMNLDTKALERKITIKEQGTRCRILSITPQGEGLGLKLASDQILLGY